MLPFGIVQQVDGAFTRIEPFSGDIQESWESFENFRSTVDTLGYRTFLSGPMPIFGGFASIDHPQFAVYEPHVANANLVTSGKAQTADGVRGLGLMSSGSQILPEHVEFAAITFSHPITAIGGYWGAATDYLYDPEVMAFQFFDSTGHMLATDEKPYTRSFLISEAQMVFWGDGMLEWVGWHFEVPVKKVSFGGGFIVADYLQANPIPEPRSLSLAAFFAVCTLGAGLRAR
jgi:hypothetical protein